MGGRPGTGHGQSAQDRAQFKRFFEETERLKGMIGSDGKACYSPFRWTPALPIRAGARSMH
jgi:hypothetical protein